MNLLIKKKTNYLLYPFLIILEKVKPYHFVYILIFLTPFMDKTQDDGLNFLKFAIFIMFVLIFFLLLTAELSFSNVMKKQSINGVSFFIASTYFVFFLSCIFANNIAVALVRYRHIIYGTVFAFAIVTYINNVDKFKILNKIIISSAIIISLVAVYQIITHQTFYRDIYPRINSIFWDPNIFARYLVAVSAILIPHIWYSKGKRIIKIGLYIFFSLIVFLSLSRTALVAQILIIILFFAINKEYKLLIYILIISIPLVVGGYFLLEKMRFVNATRTYEGVLSILIRIDVIKGGLKMFLDNWIIGVGLDNFKLVFGKYTTMGMIISSEGFSIHSWPIQVLSEQGILGFIVLLITLYKIILSVMTQIKESQNTEILKYLQGSFLAFMVFWIFGLAYHNFFDNELFWLFSGMLISILSYSKNKKIKYD